jgi:SAM-dependent methyltransferase
MSSTSEAVVRQVNSSGRPSWQAYFSDIYLRAVGFPGPEQSALEADAIEYLLDLRPGDLVLDLGCGAGRHALELARRGYQVVGVDYSVAFLRLAAAQAREEGIAVRFVRADVRALPFVARFDAVYCVLGTFGLCDRRPESTAERLAQPRSLLAGAARALKPGGRLLIDGPHAPGLAGTAAREAVDHRGSFLVRERWRFDLASRTMRSVRTVKEFTSRAARSPQRTERYATYLAAFDAGEVHALLEAHGFTSIRLLGGYDDGRGLDGESAWFVAAAQRRL